MHLSWDILRMKEYGNGTSTCSNSARGYSKKHRVYYFREFLLQTYGSYLQPGDVVLDVAGGKGDLSWLLSNIDHYQSIVVDPVQTPSHIPKSVQFLRDHPDEIPKRSVRGTAEFQPLAALMSGFLQANTLKVQPPRQLRMCLNDTTIQALCRVVSNRETGKKEWRNCWNAEQERLFQSSVSAPVQLQQQTTDRSIFIHDAETAIDYLLRAKLVVGFHPDQATDYCFDLANVLKVPACVVPCCVFPKEFPHRKLLLNQQPVQRYPDLIRYLLERYEKVQKEELDFPGTTTARSIVLYTLPTA